MTREQEPASPLPEPARWALWLLFGASTIASLRELGLDALPALDRLGAALGVSLVVTSLGWFFFLALQRSAWWALAMLVPYLNLLAVSWFARRYWYVGARAPMLLVLGGTVLQIALLVRWVLDPPGPVLL